MSLRIFPRNQRGRFVYPVRQLIETGWKFLAATFAWRDHDFQPALAQLPHQLVRRAGIGHDRLKTLQAAQGRKRAPSQLCAVKAKISRVARRESWRVEFR